MGACGLDPFTQLFAEQALTKKLGLGSFWHPTLRVHKLSNACMGVMTFAVVRAILVSASEVDLELLIRLTFILSFDRE